MYRYLQHSKKIKNSLLSQIPHFKKAQTSGSYNSQSSNIFLSPKKKHTFNRNQGHNNNNNNSQSIINDVQKDDIQEKENQGKNSNEDEDSSYKYEDVHSKRFIEALKLEDGLNKTDFLKSEK